MKRAGGRSTVAIWSGVLTSVVGLALLGWVLTSLNDLHARLSAISPRLASGLVAAVLVVLLLLLCLGLRFVWTAGRADRRRLPEAAVASDPVAAAAQSLAAAERQIALISDEVARRALSAELGTVAEDLAARRYTIVVFGTGSAGKTSVINALLGRPAGATDPVLGTTKDGEEFEYSIDGLSEGRLRLIDTPGLSEIGAAGAMREDRARELAIAADLLLFVVDQDLREIEFRPLAALARLGKRAVLAFNKRDLYREDDCVAITARLRERVRDFIAAADVVVCAAAPAAVTVRGPSGTHSQTPAADVGDLAERLAAVLRLEGRSLLAANVLLRAKRLSDKAREAIHAARAQQAQAVVSRFTWTTAGVLFVNPVPGLGALAAAAINYQMVCEVAKLFGVAVGADVAKRMARELAQVMIKLGVVGLATEVLGKALKASVVGWVAGGALEAVAGAYLTRLAGDAFIEYFAHDQDWGEGGMQGAIERRFELQRRGEFVAEFLRQTAEHILKPSTAGQETAPPRGAGSGPP
ncbi:MAG: DUF697 domain-containing protein [Planctomycetes bacterium]|nr:DUF697 domain-containing protein [Planctomycetota bacterium]